MNLVDHSELLQQLQRVKLPIAVCVCAMLLLVITGRSKTAQSVAAAESAVQDSVSLDDEETRLAETLRLIDGVGETHVLLSCRVSAQTEYVADGDKTVILSSGGGRQDALEKHTLYPEYIGAVVVCEGGGDPNVRWSVLEAVSEFTGLRADQITVLKLSGRKGGGL